MTALEGEEYEVNQSSSDVDKGDASTHEEVACEEKKNDPMLTFLGKHGLLDIKQQLISSKLSVGHLAQVERTDLEDLCKDLNLSSSQKIRLKHAIKVLRSKRRSKRTKQEKKSKKLKIKVKKGKKPKQAHAVKSVKKNIVKDDDAKHGDGGDDHADNVR